jgi:hypothetical protein
VTKNGSTTNHALGLEETLARFYGRIEAQIDAAASTLGVPSFELREWLGNLLQGAASGTVLGSIHRVSHLRDAPTQGDSSPRTLALAGGTHGTSTRKGSPDQPTKLRGRPRKVVERAQAKWWKSLSPEKQAEVTAKRAAGIKKTLAAKRKAAKHEEKMVQQASNA